MERVVTYFQKQLLDAVSTKQLTAVCYCVDVKAHSTTGDLVPGLFVHIEQPERVAENMVYPYTIGDESKMNFDPPTCVAVDLEISGQCEGGSCR